MTTAFLCLGWWRPCMDRSVGSWGHSLGQLLRVHAVDLAGLVGPHEQATYWAAWRWSERCHRGHLHSAGLVGPRRLLRSGARFARGLVWAGGAVRLVTGCVASMAWTVPCAPSRQLDEAARPRMQPQDQQARGHSLVASLHNLVAALPQTYHSAFAHSLRSFRLSASHVVVRG